MSRETQLSSQLLLAWWEERYGTLTPLLRQRFLARPEIAELLKLPRPDVENAISSSRKLNEILRLARGDTSPPRAANSPTYTAPDGTPGALASYGSGLAHNPGAAEAAVGENCQDCGAWVPSGAVHNCFM
jgi:hypothetical protein